MLYSIMQFFSAPSPLLLLLIGIIILLLVFLGIEIGNLCTFASLSTFQKTEPSASPLLSILVPARNEEQSIEACIRSLLAQDYAPVEVLVLDDQSSDGTAKILHKLQAELSEEQQGRLRLLKGNALPSGWIGKNYACYQLAQEARGDYFVFTDADTIHASTMAHSVLNCMQHYSVQFLTAQPLYIQKSLGERLVIPLINFAVFTLLPVALVYHRPEPSLAMGNGQFLCFERNGYEKIGGHASVKGHILEDVLIAQTCKAAGLRIIFVDGLEQVRCRMYHSFNDVWRGFSKNLFAFYNYSLPFALFAVLFNLLLYAFPVILLCLTLFLAFPNSVISLAWSAYILAVLLRILLALRFTQQERLLTLLFCWLHPLSMTLQTLILLNSIRWRYRKAGTEWKGRYY
jgi:chlorobactene glucosyltransferase